MRTLFTKSIMLLSLTFGCLGVNAQSQPVEEINNKEEILEQVRNLIDQVKEIRNDFESEDLKSGCFKISKIKADYKKHLVSVGVRLESHRRRSERVIHWAYEQLIYFDKLDSVCKFGKNFEYVHVNESVSELKDIIKSLKKQKRKIGRSDATSNNSFQYQYNFQVKPTIDNDRE